MVQKQVESEQANYRDDMLAGTARQLLRLRYYEGAAAHRAYEQLRTGTLIFHWRTALCALRRELRYSVRLRCAGCGYRHIRVPYRRVLKYGKLYCAQGWFGNNALHRFWLAGRHGED